MNVLKAIAYATIAIALIMGGYSDYKTRKVSNVYPLIILLSGFFIGGDWGIKLMGFVFPLVAAPIAEKISKTKSGGADIKMYSAIGFDFGIYGLTYILMGMVPLCFLVNWIKHRPMTTTTMPMCTYLAISSCVYIIVSSLL